jgi:pimeloyl-ACP methyl ester carboxylesterase
VLRPLPELPGVDHRFVGVGDVTIHVAEAGDHTAEPLVLLHGWPQNWFMWRKLIGPLSDRYRVICPDLRGFGWSSAPAGSYLKAELAADIAGLLDTLGLERVRLAGHDWGGFIGFLLCVTAPERITHFLAAGIGHPWARPTGGALARVRGLARLWYMFVLGAPLLGRQLMQRLPRLPRAVISSAAADPTVWTAAELEVFVAQWSESERATATSRLYRSFLTRELPAMVRGSYEDDVMEQPAILLVGDRDPVIEAETLRHAGSNAPNLEIRELPGVGHWVPEEAPEATLAAMQELYSR